MSLHVDERSDGNLAVYLDGDLQFDTTDEALYHESLALPALCLAAAHCPSGLRVLICGGGDGLALREVLRFPGVVRADLVDCSPEMIGLGQTRFAAWNDRAFHDRRVSVHLADAWDFLHTANGYDVIICDFTVPRRPEDARVFSRDWYECVREKLAPEGILALNAVSPQATPEAFACLRQTMSAAGLSVLPYRVCIPSFRAQGYGIWAFMLAARRTLRVEDLRSLDCPVAVRQADLRQLWRAADFPPGDYGPVHSLDRPCLLTLLLNPGAPAYDLAYDGLAYDAERLLCALPVTHPSHTRAMVETLAAQVAGSVRGIDLQRLVDALMRRAADLPRELREELGRLRDFLKAHLTPWESLGLWASRLLAVLVLILTLANAVAPDNAFAKGAEGIGHAGVSRGLSGGEGSFGRTGSFNGGESPSSFHVTGSGFRTGYGRDETTDISGNSYPTRRFRYYSVHGSGGGGYSGGGSGYGVYSGAPGQKAETHAAVFVADDDLLVLDSGDVVVTLSETTYLLASGGALTFWSNDSPNPLLFLYPDPKLFEAITTELQGRQQAARQEIAVRRDWLAWVGWTAPLFAAVGQDETELHNLSDLDTRLTAASARVGSPAAGTPTVVAPDQVELFVGCVLLPDSRVALREGDGQWVYTDGRRLTSDADKSHPAPVNPALAKALRSVMQKLQKEFSADLASDDNDLKSDDANLASLENDLQQYQSLYAQNGYDGSYEVDYGTDSIAVSDAISRTQSDLQSTRSDRDQTQAQREAMTQNIAWLAQALESFKG